jgi:gamma-glutamyltranspeptidase / glutathione hydrolase
MPGATTLVLPDPRTLEPLDPRTLGRSDPTTLSDMFSSRRRDPRLGSRRSMVLGRGGMVCTSQPLAAVAGAQVLREGGNAVDAAVCAAAVLGVVEPYSTGIGGDCFLLLWNTAEQRLYGLNGSGRAPAAASIDALRERGMNEMPMLGILAVTVPGAVDAWCTAVERFGSRPLRRLLEPAIAYARDGFPVSEIIAEEWGYTIGLLQNDEAKRTFTIDGRAPRLGESVGLPGMARSLDAIAAGGRDVFYRGELAEQIVACSERHGGWLARQDLESHRSTWVEPIATDYRGHRVCEIPPNGQGLAALIGLNILECFDVAADPLSADALHWRIEAVKLAYADRRRYVADPEHARVPVAELLSKDYAQGRAALLRRDKALKSAGAGGFVGGSDTVYLTAADRDGNVVSLINSLFFAFGSGIVAGETGIALQNRGHGFSADPAHPNRLAPGKRPFHTIIPGMLLRDGKPLVSFGVMGGDMQAQGHVQVVSNLVDFGCNIQEAIDLPRFHYLESDRVSLERELHESAGGDLSRRGHAVEDPGAALARGGFGGGQGIMIDPANGAYWGGSDKRKDGCAVGF